MKTLIAGFIALAMIGSVAALAPTMDTQDQHLIMPLTESEEALPDTVAASEAQARKAEAELRIMMENMSEEEIMRGIVYEPAPEE